jgi:hypothetical protein
MKGQTMNAVEPRSLTGIQVPDTPVVAQAIDYARRACEPYLFNHVMRSWLFAVRLGEVQGTAHDGEVLAVGTLLHDVTLNEAFAGPRRFEVEGADLAGAFARDAGFDAHRTQLVWDSVALNSTPSIGLYKEAEVRLCTAGICLDVVGLQYELLPAADIAAIVAAYPRLDMKRRMTNCFCQMVKASPATSYDNFLRDFGERYVPGYSPPSSVDFVTNAPFAG